MHLHSGHMPRRRLGLRLPVLLPVRSRSTACCQLVMCACTRIQMMSRCANRRKELQGVAAFADEASPMAMHQVAADFCR
jgi:hypothetical protein